MIIPEISTTTTILTPEQIELALKDISTLPVYSDTKLGAVKHGYKSGINNAPISQWLRNGYNLAISLPLSYLVCIDVDRHNKDGLIAYNELVAKFGEIDTYTELTPTNGGLHIFVKADGILDNVKNCDLADGVEFKKNGYVVCAPSYFKGNQYKIINGVNADALINLPSYHLNGLTLLIVKVSLLLINKVYQQKRSIKLFLRTPN